MDQKKSLQVLKSVLEKSKEITNTSSDSANFKVWQNLTIRALKNVYGSESTELEHFKSLDFCFRSIVWDLAGDYTSENRKCFQNDFDIAIETIKVYIDELESEMSYDNSAKHITTSNTTSLSITKVFISHSSLDKVIVEELIELLEIIGLNHTQIFCTSFPGYGIELGEDFLERIKTELDNNVLVLFVLSNNFYNSPVSICEMGATWVKTNKHIPILIPPFDFKDIKGVIPHTQGLKINDNLNLNLLKDKISKIFSLDTIDTSVWERKRDKILKRLGEKLDIKPSKITGGLGYRKATR